MRHLVALLRLRQLLQPIFAVMLGLFLGLLVTLIAGEKPWHVLEVLVRGALGSRYDFGMTLFYSTPLIYTGLAVAVGLRVGLFNIGAEGQLTMGALACAAVGICFPEMSWPIAPVLAVLTAFLAGMAWGAIPGWLKARRGSHEVINTIMLNFIAAGAASFVTLYLLSNPESQNPETASVGSNYWVAHLGFFGDAPVSMAFFMALATAFVIWVLFETTVWGYELRAVGQNENAAKAAGINVGRNRILALAIGGGIAGLVGVGEVLGNAGRFRIGFSAEYGFTGIAVALLAKGHPLGVVFAALLFGALHKGALELDLETESVTRDISHILQALIILSVSAEGLWSRFIQPVKER